MLLVILNSSLWITQSVMGQPRQDLAASRDSDARGVFSLTPILSWHSLMSLPILVPVLQGFGDQGCLAISPFWGCSSHCLLFPNSSNPPSLLHGLCLIPYAPFLFFFLTEAAGSCIQRLHSPFCSCRLDFPARCLLASG